MPPGALALLVLRVLRSAPLHGYAIAQTIPRGRREATIHAAHLAVRDAVARLAADGTLQTDRIAQP